MPCTKCKCINIRYLFSIPGILKITQLTLGSTCFDLARKICKNYELSLELFYFIVTVTCLISTFCLLVIHVIPSSITKRLSETTYEVIYQALACLLYLSASSFMLNKLLGNIRLLVNIPYWRAMIEGFFAAALYLVSALCLAVVGRENNQQLDPDLV